MEIHLLAVVWDTPASAPRAEVFTSWPALPAQRRRNLEKASMQPNVLENEPGLALFVENDDPLLFYRKIADFATQKLKKGGQLFFEINQYLGAETKQLLQKENFRQITLRKDLNGNDRMLMAEKI